MKCKILMTEFVTHDVKSFIVEKPKGYSFLPGQATEVSIAEEKWADEKRPFTFTSRRKDDVLQFKLKRYPERDGVTDKLHELDTGDELEIGDAWGSIKYSGKGVFIAGGAGVTPFIAILRDLQDKGELEGHKLIFSNKCAKDIILEKEFREMLGSNFITTLTDETSVRHNNGRINKEFLKKSVDDFSQTFYVCGPPKFVEDIVGSLKELGVKEDLIVVEE